MRNMKHSGFAALALLGALAACATESGGPPRESGRAQVTRFFLAPQIARAAVFVEPLDPRMASGPRYAVIRGAVEDNLRTAGFRPVPTRDAAELVAVVGLTRSLRPQLAEDRTNRASFGFGAAGGGGRGGVGGGLGVSFPLGRHREVNRDVAVDTLTLSLRRRSDATVEWEGRAVGEARAANSGDPTDRAFFLARALLSDFPGKSGVTVNFPPRR